jgi:hypothetical protein
VGQVSSQTDTLESIYREHERDLRNAAGVRTFSPSTGHKVLYITPWSGRNSPCFHIRRLLADPANAPVIFIGCANRRTGRALLRRFEMYRDKLPRMRALTAASLLAVLSLGWIGYCAQTSSPATSAVSRVHQLEIEDQPENPGNISAEEYYRHGDARRAEIRRLLAEGKITTGGDFSDAALIFQQGRTPEDFLFAHILAVDGLIRGGAADKWIAAATLDRYLQAIDRSQVFGTQYPGTRLPGTCQSRWSIHTCSTFSGHSSHTMRSCFRILCVRTSAFRT